MDFDKIVRDKIEDLTPSGVCWAIDVKVLRLWRQPGDGGDTIEMILSDEKGLKIWARILERDVFRYQNKIKQGDWKFLMAFRVVPFVGHPWIPDQKNQIIFRNPTFIDNIDPKSDSIFLDAPKFEDVIDYNIDPYELRDFIGVVSSVGHLIICNPPPYLEESYKLYFDLIDEEHNIVNCYANGNIAKYFFDQWNMSPKNRVICILRFWMFGEGEDEDAGKLFVRSSSGCSEFMFNPNTTECNEFKNKFDLNYDSAGVLDA